jgi:putative tryptophan/tyrosine transport system substrate-binding protein
MKNIVSILLIIAVVVMGAIAKAQQPAKIPRIGWITGASLASNTRRIEAFRGGLRELGYIEGKNIAIEWRGADSNPDRLRSIIAELTNLKLEVIVAAGGAPVREAKKAAVTIPIVFAQDPDPIGNGFVASLSRPGGNITGLSRLAPELSGKQVELLHEIVPKLARLAVFISPSNRANAQVSKEIEPAAAALGIKLQYFDVSDANDFEPSFRETTKGKADAILWLAGGEVASPHRRKIAELAVKSRLPTIYEQAAFVEAGGLMSYGVSFTDLDRRAATYVDKILKGAKPGDLPVEQPKKFEFVINLKAAKQIGLTIPQSVLYRADKVIK